MIMKDAVTDFLITLSRFSSKKGQDITTNKDLVVALNVLTGEPILKCIYVNSQDSITIPDVAVLHLYNQGFAGIMLNPDSSLICPFGYTIEIHSRCFEKYTDEELGAVILHDILQNVLSDTAKIRMLKAYTAVSNRYRNDQMLDLFDDTNLDEVIFIIFSEICMRPFRVPAENDYVATDDVLKAVGLADAYNSYLDKTLAMSDRTVEEVMTREMNDDIRDMNTILTACMDNSIRAYYNMLRKAVPMLSFEHVMGNHHGHIATGFIPSNYRFGPKVKKMCEAAIDETFNDPKTEIDIQYQIDKIIGNLRYAESEAEREVVLFKIKQLSIKLTKLDQKLSRESGSNKVASDRRKFIAVALEQLEDLRKQTVSKEIKEKHWHVYAKCEMPEGYDF